MKKKELLKRIEALEKQVNSMRALQVAGDCIDKEDVIYVPDGVLTHGMQIINGNHVLFYDGRWNVLHSENGWYPSRPYKFMLEPCKREDLKAGDVAFRTDLENHRFENLSNYCIILDKGEQYWSGKSCVFCDLNWDYWYKVVEA